METLAGALVAAFICGLTALSFNKPRLFGQVMLPCILLSITAFAFMAVWDLSNMYAAGAIAKIEGAQPKRVDDAAATLRTPGWWKLLAFGLVFYIQGLGLIQFWLSRGPDEKHDKSG